MTLVEARRILPRALFSMDTGRLIIRELARFHIAERYGGKSVRCRDCVVNSRCEGAHINLVRSQGLGQLTPLVAGEQAEDALQQLSARWPIAPLRLSTGRPAEPAAPSLPGYAAPTEAPRDPLALQAKRRADRKAERLKARATKASGATQAERA